MVEVSKKLKYLRNNYADEKRKMGKNASGQGRDKVYVPKWKFFPTLSFLDNHMSMVPSATTSNLLDLSVNI